ncbi:TerB family tellurite resistance protein [Vibrio fortis]|jgi:tellurite resistance protein|uniref:tellurite resistance TerB family protein n=1 Tax=Vibrio fortis TaxID=212667 RepID=UPI0036F404E8|tara:strand:- start:2386 stop:3018 length:633 start_codon:yes stop_codon:yes gene_type:complete
MGFWKTAGWIAAGVGAVVAAPVTGGGSIAAVIGAAGTTTAAGVAVGAAAGLAGSTLTDDSKDKARREGRNEGRAEKAQEVSKLKTALQQQESHFASHKDYEDYLIALTTVGMACAACDGVIDPAEKQDINEFITGIAGTKLPESVKTRILEITESLPTFNTAFKAAEPYMNSDEDKQNFIDVIESTMYADGNVSEREERFLEAWKHKLAA